MSQINGQENDPLEGLTVENVEEELKKLKLIEENYVSDDEEQVNNKFLKHG